MRRFDYIFCNGAIESAWALQINNRSLSVNNLWYTAVICTSLLTINLLNQQLQSKVSKIELSISLLFLILVHLLSIHESIIPRPQTLLYILKFNTFQIVLTCKLNNEIFPFQQRREHDTDNKNFTISFSILHV